MSAGVSGGTSSQDGRQLRVAFPSFNSAGAPGASWLLQWTPSAQSVPLPPALTLKLSLSKRGPSGACRPRRNRIQIQHPRRRPRAMPIPPPGPPLIGPQRMSGTVAARLEQGCRLACAPVPRPPNQPHPGPCNRSVRGARARGSGAPQTPQVFPFALRAEQIIPFPRYQNGCGSSSPAAVFEYPVHVSLTGSPPLGVCPLAVSRPLAVIFD